MFTWVTGLIAGRNKRRGGGDDGKLGDFALSDDERTLLNTIYQLSQGSTELLINRENVVVAARFESSFGERLLRALQREHLIEYVPIGCLCITEAGIVCASSAWSDDQSATVTDAAGEASDATVTTADLQSLYDQEGLRPEE